MKSKEIYEELSSGAWVQSALKHYDLERLENEEDVSALTNRLAIHFQELFEAYNQTLIQEEADEALEVQRVTEALNQDNTLIDTYKEQGWKVSKRSNKAVDTDGFIEDHREEIPKEALAVVKSKLTPFLKKEFTKYESITGYTYSAKR